MLAIAFIRWWYSDGWIMLAKKSAARLRRLYLTFSVPMLLRSLFAPWRRIISYPGQTLGEKLRAGVDNLISRLVGFMVRIMVLLVATILMILLLVASIALILAWPLAPAATLFLIARGFGT